MEAKDLTKEAFLEKGYIISDTLFRAVKTALNTKPIAGAFLFGLPGTGKTFLAETLAQIENGEVFFYQCFMGTREDDLLVKLLPSESTISGIKMYDGVIVKACESAKQKKITYLILDEWDKASPSTDATLYDFLEYGRINYGDKHIKLDKDEMSYLRVFITLNEEREMTPALRRRLPIITFNPLSPRLIREALQMTHKDNPYVEACVNLYQRSLMAGWDEPATVKELRQLLDAIQVLGEEEADWDELVMQYVSKTKERHYLLKETEYKEVYSLEEDDRVVLNPEKYSLSLTEEPSIEVEKRLRLPKKFYSAVEKAMMQEEQEEVDTTNVYAVVELNDNSYDKMVNFVGEPSEKEEEIGDIAFIKNKKIYGKRPFSLEETINLPWGEKGEVLFIEPRAKAKDILNLKKKGLKIVKYVKDEILAKSKDDTVLIRWTPQVGAEIITSLEMDYLEKYGIAFQRIEQCPGSYGCSNSRKSERGSAWVSGCFHLKKECGGIFEYTEEERLKIKQEEEKAKQEREQREKENIEKIRKIKKNAEKFDSWGINIIDIDGLSELGIKKPIFFTIETGAMDADNKMHVTAKVYLPCEENQEGRIYNNLVFNNEALWGERLSIVWGNLTEDKKYRYMKKDFRGDTYKEAGYLAYIEITEQLKNLKKALEERAKKVKREEEEIKKIDIKTPKRVVL